MTPLAVYVHIPFCTVKCGYCDFNAYAGMGELVPAYEAAILREVETWADVLADGDVHSIAFGGGTPGEFPASGIAAVIAAVLRRAGAISPELEVSLEANPGTTTLPYLQALRAAGVTRLSFGAQSFHAHELRFLDRIHSPEAIGASVALARRAGFQSLNLDLIFGLPWQELASWQASVEAALDLQPDHLSCYALTVEEGTPLAHLVASGEVPMPDPDLGATMYEWTRDRLASAGLVHYEISNWSRPGHQSRHNRVYWTGGDYLGIGAGAHGFLAGERYENVAHPRVYAQRLAASQPMDSLGSPIAERPSVLSTYYPEPPIAMFDWLETHLRLIRGFPDEEFVEAFGMTLEDVCPGALQRVVDAELLQRARGRTRLTPRGQLLHSEVCAEMLAELTTPDH